MVPGAGGVVGGEERGGAAGFSDQRRGRGGGGGDSEGDWWGVEGPTFLERDQVSFSIPCDRSRTIFGEALLY